MDSNSCYQGHICVVTAAGVKVIVVEYKGVIGTERLSSLVGCLTSQCWGQELISRFLATKPTASMLHHIGCSPQSLRLSPCVRCLHVQPKPLTARVATHPLTLGRRKAELAKLADSKLMLYPQSGHTTNYRCGTGQRKFAGRHKQYNHGAMPPTTSHHVKRIKTILQHQKVSLTSRYVLFPASFDHGNRSEFFETELPLPLWLCGFSTDLERPPCHRQWQCSASVRQVPCPNKSFPTVQS